LVISSKAIKFRKALKPPLVTSGLKNAAELISVEFGKKFQIEEKWNE
jgi:hypothetical protein